MAPMRPIWLPRARIACVDKYCLIGFNPKRSKMCDADRTLITWLKLSTWFYYWVCSYKEPRQLCLLIAYVFSSFLWIFFLMVVISHIQHTLICPPPPLSIYARSPSPPQAASQSRSCWRGARASREQRELGEIRWEGWTVIAQCWFVLAKQRVRRPWPPLLSVNTKCVFDKTKRLHLKLF
jgi:hypothetical protein